MYNIVLLSLVIVLTLACVALAYIMGISLQLNRTMLRAMVFSNPDRLVSISMLRPRPGQQLSLWARLNQKMAALVMARLRRLW